MNACKESVCQIVRDVKLNDDVSWTAMLAISFVFTHIPWTQATPKIEKKGHRPSKQRAWLGERIIRSKLVIIEAYYYLLLISIIKIFFFSKEANEAEYPFFDFGVGVFHRM
jgi:hypothetical protein